MWKCSSCRTLYLRCPECDGRRYREEVLENLHGLSIADVLALTVAEARDFFRGEAFAKNKTAAEAARLLDTLAEVGLDYLQLGQPVQQ